MQNRPRAASEDPDPASHTVGTRVGGIKPPRPAPPPLSRSAPKVSVPVTDLVPPPALASGAAFAASRPQPPRGQSRSAASTGQRVPDTHRLPRAVPRLRPEEKEGRARLESPAYTSAAGPNRRPLRQATAPPTRGRLPPIKRSGWKAGPIRSCWSVPAVGKERSQAWEPGVAVVGGIRILTGNGCDQWRGTGGGRGRNAHGTRVNGLLCTRDMNGGLCEGQRWRVAGGWNAWVPGELAGRRDRRENSLLSIADRVPGTLLDSHPPGRCGRYRQ